MSRFTDKERAYLDYLFRKENLEVVLDLHWIGGLDPIEVFLQHMAEEFHILHNYKEEKSRKE